MIDAIATALAYAADLALALIVVAFLALAQVIE